MTSFLRQRANGQIPSCVRGNGTWHRANPDGRSHRSDSWEILSSRTRTPRSGAGAHAAWCGGTPGWANTATAGIWALWNYSASMIPATDNSRRLKDFGIQKRCPRRVAMCEHPYTPLARSGSLRHLVREQGQSLRHCRSEPTVPRKQRTGASRRNGREQPVWGTPA